MVTYEQARKVCLSMPEMEQGWFRRPDFRIRGKIFAAAYGGTGIFDLKVGLDEQGLLATYRMKFFIPAVGARAGWISVRLSTLQLAEFEALVWKAWRYTAPPRLALSYS